VAARGPYGWRHPRHGLRARTRPELGAGGVRQLAAEPWWAQEPRIDVRNVKGETQPAKPGICLMLRGRLFGSARTNALTHLVYPFFVNGGELKPWPLAMPCHHRQRKFGTDWSPSQDPYSRATTASGEDLKRGVWARLSPSSSMFAWHDRAF